MWTGDQMIDFKKSINLEDEAEETSPIFVNQ